MSKYGLIYYPHNTLSIRSESLNYAIVKTSFFVERINYMFSTMYYKGGVGLAAPQINWPVRLFIANPLGRSHHKTLGRVFINPTIHFDGTLEEDEEGCLSIPGIFANVERSSEIVIKYLNEHLEAKEEKYNGFWARIIQHEYDHLNGVMFTDRLSFSEFNIVQKDLEAHCKKIRKLRKKRENSSRKLGRRKKGK